MFHVNIMKALWQFSMLIAIVFLTSLLVNHLRGNGIAFVGDWIDPKAETERYVTGVLEKNRSRLSEDDMALLEEEMRSPCIEEIAVFQAFAQTVAKGERGFVVLDTAPHRAYPVVAGCDTVLSSGGSQIGR